MDLTTLLKGASNTMKKLESDSATKPTQSAAGGWNSWGGGEDDAWEDVAEMLPTRIQTTSQKMSTEVDSEQGRIEVKRKLQTHDGENKSTESQEMRNDADDTSCDDESAIIKSLREKVAEALKRAAAAEGKLYVVSRERDNLRRAADDQASRGREVESKERKIQAILAEGEKLSIRVAEKEAAARALKRDLKEQNAVIEELRALVAANEAKLKNATNKQKQLETSENAAREALASQEERLTRAENAARSNSSNSAALDAARAELESLRKSQANALEDQARKLRAGHEAVLGAVKMSTQKAEDTMDKAMMELETHLSKVIEDAGRREDQLRYEAEESRKLAEELKARNEELVAAIPNATRPLVRQVEALQAAALNRSRTKSAVERSQAEQLRTAQAALNASQERERVVKEKLTDLQNRATALESQLKAAQSERKRACAELESLREVHAKSLLDHQREKDETVKLLRKLTKAKETAEHELSRDRVAHITALEAVSKREESLRDQVASLETQLQNTPRQRQSSSSLNVTSSLQVSGSLDNLSAGSFSFDEGGTTDILSDSYSSGVVYAMDKLKLTLRKRDGEVSALQARLKRKEVASEALAEDVVKLTSEVEQLKKDHGDAPVLKKELGDLKRRHSALLELLGEREERIAELDADLADVKQMYKEQITELLMKLENVSR
ncbi:Golgin candidate 5 [Gracilariopsis chorda]|uniref:Golgin candidate 5 n=1 Tax=Gracilariopsis chorda TaxID=448386 RepID=A0A2V3IN21_9FLOR|nr:Golgin candidate 5 [Gracilariopsis chorda]|eukprot:PXF43481.1 Golgin candidate 5 [Gracilariopsis chorda]